MKLTNLTVPLLFAAATILGGVATTHAAYSNTVVSLGAIAYWRLNETNGTTAADAVRSRVATHNPGVTVGLIGPQSPVYPGLEADNAAASYDGAAAATTTGVSLMNDRPQFTLAGWFNSTAAQSNRTGLFGQNGAVAVGFATPTTIELRTRAGGQVDADIGDKGTNGSWHCLVATGDGTALSLYLDGQALGAGGLATTNYGSSTNGFTFGDTGLFEPAGSSFTGRLDEIAVFARALSADEVATLYSAAAYAPTAPPIITLQPASQSVPVGSNATFTVGALGGVPWAYQWQHEGTNLPGATASTLTIPSVSFADAGAYVAVVTNAGGTTNSAVATLTVMPPLALCDLTNDLVLHLQFDGTLADFSRRGHNGTPVGALTFVAGKIGSRALHYSTDVGNNSFNYVTLGAPADLQFGAEVNFTVAFWVRFTGTPGDLPFLCSAVGSYNMSRGLTFAPSYAAGGWAYSLVGDAGTAGIEGPQLIGDGQWHHLVHTFDRTGNGTTYLDGQAIDACPITGLGNVDSGQPFTIGQDPTGAYPESGWADLDDLGIWRRVLTEDEVKCMYALGENYGLSFDTTGQESGEINLRIRQSAAGIEVLWDLGTLEFAEDLLGPWNPVPGATPPVYQVTPDAAKKFYRVKR